MTKCRKQILLALAFYDEEMHKGAAEYARKHDCELSVVSPENGPVYRFWEGDGIIATLLADPNNEMTRFVLDFPGPKILFGKVADKFPENQFSEVYEDNEKIGRLAADYFINKGFRNFHYVAAGRRWHVCDRGESFRARIAEAGFLSSECFFMEHINDSKEMFEFLALDLKKYPKPLAVFCGFDNVAQWVIQGCRLAGLRVPEDVAVLGTANHEMVCEWGGIPSSSIDTNTRFWAFKAAKLLDELIAGKAEPNTTILIPPLQIVERASTDTFAVPDLMVAKAMRFIGENLHRPISRDEVVTAAGSSNTALSRRFKASLNHSIVDEINLQKIEEAKRLLADRSKNTVEIAAELGFSTPFYFYQILKKQVGMTPKEYRQTLFP